MKERERERNEFKNRIFFVENDNKTKDDDDNDDCGKSCKRYRNKMIV